MLNQKLSRSQDIAGGDLQVPLLTKQISLRIIGFDTDAFVYPGGTPSASGNEDQKKFYV